MEKKKNEIISVTPDSIFFRDIALGDTDTAEMWIRNIGSKPISIRIKMPADSPFSLSTSSLPMVVPGLETKIIIFYTAKSDTPINSKLFVCGDDCNILVPITTIPPCPRIVPENKRIDLGTIGLNTSFKFTFSLSNIGILEGKYKLSSTDTSLTFIPEEGLIQPSKTAEIACNFQPQKEGNFTFTIKADIEGAFESCDPIEVSYKSISQSLELLLNDIEVKELDFQTIYFGQKRVITATLHNKGSFKQSFVFLPPKKTDDISTKSNSPNYNVFTAVPSEGLINPHGSSVIRFVFNPPPEKIPEEDVEATFNQYMTIEVVETSQKIEFQMIGKAVHHLVSLSLIDFNFEKTPVKSKSSQTLTIQNGSHFLMTSFEIKPIAQFKFEPSKGTIKANQKVDVNIVFYPKNLGTFELSTLITFCGGLSKRKINLNGLCEEDEKQFKRVPVYETDQETRFNAMHPDTRFAYDLDEIKKKEAARAKNDAYLVESEMKRAEATRRREVNSRMRKDAELYLSRTVGHFTQEDVKEFIQSKANDEEYMRKYKSAEEGGSSGNDRKSRVADNGLVPPDPPLRMKKDPLYVQNPSKFGLISTSTDEKTAVPSAKKDFQDENVLIKRKFKSKPTTPVEINESTRTLTPAQQLMIASSHQTINFGSVSVFAKVAKCFSIQNNLQQNILVTMKYEFDELSESSPVTQIIPPGQLGGFDIRFSSGKPENFAKTIQYTINGRHNYGLNVCAQVVPIDVQLSRSAVDFRFTPDSTSPIIKEYVTLTNKSNAPAEFKWSYVPPPFYIEKINGRIESGKSTSVEIVYRPGTKSRDEEELVCDIVGGYSRTLKCVGEVGTPKVTLPKKALNFGLIPIGIEQSLQLKMKNGGDDDALFTVSIPATSPELRVTPKSGRVGAKESLSLTVAYKAISAHTFDVPVTVDVCGAQPLSFSVSGQSEFPDVMVTTGEFEFGRIYVGSSSSIQSQISNTSKIPAVLILDFTQHPDFRIDFEPGLADELSDEADGEKKNSISLVSDSTFVTKMEGNRGEYMSIKEGQIDGENEDNGENVVEKGLVYELTLAPQSSIYFALVFEPTKVADHSFELPMSLLNASLPSSFKLQPIVSAEAIESPITMSSNALDFGVRPIYDAQNPNCPPKTLQVRLTSEAFDVVEWRMELKGSKEEVFAVSPMEGLLNPSKSEFVQIQFMPKSATPFNSFLSLYVVSKGKEDNMIGKVQLTGAGSSEMFKPSLHEICMPIVPVNTKSQMDISIVNLGKIQSTLKIEMPVSEFSFPVKFSFPEGNQLQHTTQELPLSITFCSPKPMSFTTVVAIVDDLGNASSFVLTCTCDNSVFTIFPFLASHDKAEKAVTFSRESFDSVELQARFLTSADVIELKEKNWNVTFSPVMITFFQRYLNVLVLSSQVNDFPGDLIKSNGALIHEAISNLTGGKKAQETFSELQGKKKNLGDTMKSKGSSESAQSAAVDSVATRRNMFKELLHTLQSNGALLSSVRPEFLMKKSDFMALMKVKVTKQILGVDYFGAPDVASFDQKVMSEVKSSKNFSNALLARLDVLETVYDGLSIEAWMTVVLQVMKLFVMARVDTEKVGSVAGFADASKQAKAILASQPNGNELFNEISKSAKAMQSFSTMSAQELTLLKWISLHYIKCGGDINRRFADFTSLQDSVGFSYLVRSHSTLYKNVLDEEPSNKGQIEANAVEFINGLRNLQLPFLPKAEEIVDGSPCILASISEYLYETLPHYLPSVTLEFNTSLHKPLTRSISLTNPSKNEIVYYASLDGDRSFALVQNMATVGPGQTVEFSVTFLALTIRKVSARLTLIPGRPRTVTQRSAAGRQSAPPSSRASGNAKGLPSFSAPVVVDITSSVTVEGPDETFNVETNVYAPKTIEIPVKNVLGVNGLHLKVYIKTDKTADESGKAVKGLEKSLQEFIENPDDMSQKVASSEANDFNEVISNHVAFITSTTEVSLETAESTKAVTLEFLPIELGTFRCLLLFRSDDEGEFVYEVVAKSSLPSPSDTSVSKAKIEAGKTSTVAIHVDAENAQLLRALAYSLVKGSGVSEWKFKDLVTRKVHELETLFRKTFERQDFSVISSSQYFEVEPNFTLAKTAASSLEGESKKDAQKQLLVEFKPIKAGDYPCKVALLSANDIRVFQVRGIGLPATKELLLEFSTAFGRSVHQDIPFSNPSNEPWQLKVNLTGDKGFTSPSHMTVKPKSQSSIPVTFSPSKIGTFSAQLTVNNLAKESTTIYKLLATVDEPPAEEKVVVECKARQATSHAFSVKPFIKSGQCEVTSTVPLIEFPSEVTFNNGEELHFTFSFCAPRSGVSAGTITFTDPQTGNYIWYIVEIHISPPAPEGAIDVVTSAHKSVTVEVPVENNNSFSVVYNVSFSNEDILHGQTPFIAPPSYKSSYPLVVVPSKPIQTVESVHFYSEEGGEFWYKLNVTVEPSQCQVLAPLTAPIGKIASVTVVIENKSSKLASYSVENDNSAAFQVGARSSFQLEANGAKKVEIRYTPNAVGIKETAKIAFKSEEGGDYEFALNGTGKPPQPLSPTIVTASLESSNSALILFTNPFARPSRFSVSLTSDREDVFRFLVKKKIFTLNNYGEEFQIPFTFAPDAIGQFNGHIVVSSLGPSRGPLPDLESLPSIRWIYPIIGNCTETGVVEGHQLKSKAQQTVNQNMTFALIGENDSFELSEYKISMEIPPSVEFIRTILDLKPEKIEKKDNIVYLTVKANFSPQRPFNQNITITVKNQIGQEWKFPLDLSVDLGKPCETIVIESLLNKTGTAKINVPSRFRERTPFHAYFAAGSASEFSLTDAHGIIEASGNDVNELPVEVLFAPKMYGKILKGLLVVDTLDAQFLFDIVGKTPDYVPPVAKKSTLEEETKKPDIVVKKKRNIIKDNIEGVRITKPRLDQK